MTVALRPCSLRKRTSSGLALFDAQDIIDIRLNQASSPSAWACASLRASCTTLSLLEKMISTGQETSSLATRQESRSLKSLNAKRLRLILLQGAQNKLPGMILLQERAARASRASIVNVGNYLRICTFREISGREGRARKSLRMISLQNHENKPSGMIFLRKKWGEGWGGALLVPNSLRRERPAANVMDIRSFAAITKTSGAWRR